MTIPLIDESHYQAQMDTVVMPALKQCSTEGWMDPAQAAGLGEPATEGKLHYVCYDAREFDKLNVEGATAMFNGAIVISHGFTEFATKYSEMIWYFMLAGYSVCFLEHRGHGRSVRDIDNPSLVWIDDWHRYVADLNKFAFDVGREYAGGRPLFLYSHSMGGGIGAALLETYPDTFDRAVLSSPMIAPQTGMPNWAAYLLSSLMCVCGLGKHIVFGQSEFTPELDMSDHQGACEARVRWYQQQRIDDVHNQTYAATFEWVRQSLKLSHAVQKPRACENIDTPLLLFQAERDQWVLNEAQNRFIHWVLNAGGNAKLVRVPSALHEIFSMPNEILGPYLERILAFYADADELNH